MKSTALIPLAVALVLGCTGPALAKKVLPGPDWMSVEQVIQKLREAGYSAVTNVKADDGHWEGEGLKNGVRMEFHVDPRTGAITKEKSDDDDD